VRAAVGSTCARGMMIPWVVGGSGVEIQCSRHSASEKVS
jgi:hypothetical protein